MPEIRESFKTNLTENRKFFVKMKKKKKMFMVYIYEKKLELEKSFKIEMFL